MGTVAELHVTVPHDKLVEFSSPMVALVAARLVPRMSAACRLLPRMSVHCRFVALTDGTTRLVALMLVAVIDVTVAEVPEMFVAFSSAVVHLVLATSVSTCALAPLI